MNSAKRGKRKASKAKARTWPNRYTRTHPSGQASYIVDLGLINGKRERHSFKTKEEADTFAEQAKIKRLNEGLAGFSLPLDTRNDALKASSLLNSHGVSLVKAAQYYLDHVIAFQTAPTINEIVQKMITEAEGNKRRDRTVSDLRSRLEHFEESFANARLKEITLSDVKDWIDEHDWSARTRINYLTKLSQLYNYALKHGWVDKNLMQLIDRPDVEDKEPGIFTVTQAEDLLKHAQKFNLMPYTSIGFFAGLRTAELMRIEGSAINLPEKSIIVGAKVAKKRSRRVVEMCDALVAWLKPCLPIHGPIVDVKMFRENWDNLKTAANITKWPPNGLRHSFGSYHLALHGDAIKTANQMGHRDSTIVHNHYKALVLKSEAEKFWGLRPKDANAE